MTRIRLIIFLLTIIVVSVFGYIAVLVAKGYKFNFKDKKLTSSGLLVLKSDPQAAQVVINGEEKEVTNINLSLAPNTYDVVVKKDGYHSWEKRLTIEKEVVVEVNVHLFKIAPSLSPITLESSLNPIPSDDFTKIAYLTTKNTDPEKNGLWILETVNLPLGFAKDPRRVTDGDLTDSTWIWSPDGRQILLETAKGTYLLETGNFTSQSQRVNITAKKQTILENWDSERRRRLEARLRGLPDEVAELLKNKASRVTFSPDEKKILYLAESDHFLPDDLIKPIPGVSTQSQSRSIGKGNVYVYDAKQDRNFFISEAGSLDNCPDVVHSPALPLSCSSTLAWFPTSAQLVIASPNKIEVVEYDNTNRQEIYTGSYVAPFAFPSVSNDRLIILTNLGADSSLPNLYTLSIK